MLRPDRAPWPPAGARRLRALVLAEAANPDRVSAPLAGWSLAAALREVADVHVVTRIRNRDAILRQGRVEGEDVTALDSEALARPASTLAEALRGGSGKGWTTLQAISTRTCPQFERLAWRAFGDAIRAGRCDVVHRVTPLGPTSVSPIAARCAAAGVPFAMGPLDGGVLWPPGFEAERRQEKEWLSDIRGLHRMLPGRPRMLKASALILAGSRATEAELPDSCADRIRHLPDTAFLPERFGVQVVDDPAGPLRAVFIGRMAPCKGPDMLLEAAADACRDGRLALEMVGDGPMLEGLRARAEAPGIAGAVTFHGRAPHEKVQDVAARRPVLAFPSVRELGGGVAPEAMALGAVPIVVDHAGPGERVEPEFGFKVPIGPREDVVAGTRAAPETALARRADVQAMGVRARARARADRTWAAKARRVPGAWHEMLDRRAAA